MLRIHTGLQKRNKNNVYDKHIREINPIGINEPCINIEKSELLFEKYRMALKLDKDVIEIQKDDAIKRNRIFFDFILRMFNHINELYVKEKSILVDTILKRQSRNESAKKVEKPNRYNNTRNGNKEDTSKPSPENGCFVNETNQTSRERSYTYKSNLNAKTGSCSEASSSEEEDIGMCKGRRKSDFDNTNKEINESSSEEEEIPCKTSSSLILISSGFVVSLKKLYLEIYHLL